jgi:hypothetical protein
MQAPERKTSQLRHATAKSIMPIFPLDKSLNSIVWIIVFKCRINSPRVNDLLHRGCINHGLVCPRQCFTQRAELFSLLLAIILKMKS